MPNATIEIIDEVNIRIRGVDQITLQKAQEHLTYFFPAYMFTPAYKLGRWDGRIKLLTASGMTYLNLLEDILPILENGGYSFEIVDFREDYSGIIEQIKLPDNQLFSQYQIKDKPVILRDYQLSAIHTAIQTGAGLLELATGSGKTLICAAISRVYMDYGHVVVIVPDIGLILQTQYTFNQVGLNAGVWYMDAKDRRQVTISTWQSLDKTPELFSDVKCVILDEAHQGKAKTINEIMTGPAANVPFRFGCTGTVPKEDLFRQQLKASIGPVIFKYQTWQLQNQGVLAQTKITQFCLLDTHNPDYPDYVPEENRKNRRNWGDSSFEEWKDQVNWFFHNKARLNYVRELVLSLTEENGNTLILVQFREHGKILEQLIPGSISLDGRDRPEFRKEVYDSFDTTDGNILIATMGIASTGIDIPRIFNLIVIEQGKKFEKVMQILGRGLRKTEDKHTLSAIDIHGNHGFSYAHANKRRALYREANQEVERIEVEYHVDFE